MMEVEVYENHPRILDILFSPHYDNLYLNITRRRIKDKFLFPFMIEFIQ